MQKPGEKIRHSRLNRRKQSAKSPHISSFGMLNRNGLEIPKGVNMPAIKENNQSIQSIFSAVSMPEQEQGYIKCKKYDFL